MSDQIEWCVKCGVRPAKRLFGGIPVYLPCEVCLRESTDRIAASMQQDYHADEMQSMSVNSLLGRDNE